MCYLAAVHPKNRYRKEHDFLALVQLEPQLAAYLTRTPDGRTSLDFSAPQAVYLLNRTLLRRDYGLTHWALPEGHLVPPIPGRLDYVHTLADLLPQARTVLDVGTGASLIYPILGRREYDWSFVGSEVNPTSLRVARAIIKANRLRHIELRQPSNPQHLFRGVVRPGEYFDLTMCNPPFFDSRTTARRAARSKWKKLGRKDRGLTFGGADSELVYPGGEAAFLRTMIGESAEIARQVGWFTTLVSRGGYLRSASERLDRLNAKYQQLPLAQGNKRMRILAWRFA